MISLRPLTSDDFFMIWHWLRRPHVKQWWDDGQTCVEEVVETFSDEPETIQRYILEMDEAPMGYGQICTLDDGRVGVDLFLAHVEWLAKGLGQASLRALVDEVARQGRSQVVTIDPHPDNDRAIACYEKVGFVHRPKESNESLYFMALELDQMRG